MQGEEKSESDPVNTGGVINESLEHSSVEDLQVLVLSDQTIT